MTAIENPSSTSSSRFKTAKMLLLATAIAIALVAAGYTAASIQGSSRMAAQKARHEKNVLALQDDLQSTRKALASTTARNHLLLASAALYRTTADLDDRNFGTANTHLQEAATAMSKAAAVAGTVDPKVAKLSADLGRMNINVATDLGAQRSTVLALAAQVDGLAQGTE